MAEYMVAVEYKVKVPDDIDHNSSDWSDVREQIEEEIPDLTVWRTVQGEDGEDEEYEITGERGEIAWWLGTEPVV